MPWVSTAVSSYSELYAAEYGAKTITKTIGISIAIVGGGVVPMCANVCLMTPYCVGE